MKLFFKRQPDWHYGNGEVWIYWSVYIDGNPIKNEIGEQLTICNYPCLGDYWHNYGNDKTYRSFQQAKSALIALLEEAK